MSGKHDNGPVLIELQGAPSQTPDTAPEVPESDLPESDLPEGRAMQAAAALAARPPSPLGRWFWRLLGALAAFFLGLRAWDFVAGLIARSPWLGYAALALVGAFVLLCAGIALREWAAFARLRRLDAIRRMAAAALEGDDLDVARQVVARLRGLYAGRDELEWGLARLAEREGELFCADALLEQAEAEVLAPLDAAARREIEAAARQVAAVTALVPLALADVVAALAANLRMIRRIAEIYGGRAGVLGSWRLTRTVLAHLVATGAVAAGDDLIGSLAGGGVLSKISRRFGEGVINGALTARVGVAALETCRPLPFVRAPAPSVSSLLQRALSGLFGGGAGRK